MTGRKSNSNTCRNGFTRCPQLSCLHENNHLLNPGWIDTMWQLYLPKDCQLLEESIEYNDLCVKFAIVNREYQPFRIR